MRSSGAFVKYVRSRVTDRVVELVGRRLLLLRRGDRGVEILLDKPDPSLAPYLAVLRPDQVSLAWTVPSLLHLK